MYYDISIFKFRGFDQHKMKVCNYAKKPQLAILDKYNHGHCVKEQGLVSFLKNCYFIDISNSIENSAVIYRY